MQKMIVVILLMSICGGNAIRLFIGKVEYEDEIIFNVASDTVDQLIRLIIYFRDDNMASISIYDCNKIEPQPHSPNYYMLTAVSEQHLIPEHEQNLSAECLSNNYRDLHIEPLQGCKKTLRDVYLTDIVIP